MSTPLTASTVSFLLTKCLVSFSVWIIGSIITVMRPSRLELRTPYWIKNNIHCTETRQALATDTMTAAPLRRLQELATGIW
jgi:hypothetical protein